MNCIDVSHRATDESNLLPCSIAKSDPENWQEKASTCDSKTVKHINIDQLTCLQSLTSAKSEQLSSEVLIQHVVDCWIRHHNE